MDDAIQTILEHEILLVEHLHRRDDAIGQTAIPDHRTGELAVPPLVVRPAGNARSVLELHQPRVEPLVVRHGPIGDRLAEPHVVAHEPPDTVLHEELFGIVVARIHARGMRLDLSDGLRMTVLAVFDAGLDPDGHQGLLPVPSRKRPVEGNASQHPELAGQHPLVLGQNHPQVVCHPTHVRRSRRMRRDVAQQVAERHARLVPPPTAGDLDVAIPQVAMIATRRTISQWERQMPQRVVAGHHVVAHVGVVLDHGLLGRFRVQRTHGQHAGQHGQPFATTRTLVQAQHRQQPLPVQAVEHLVHVDQPHTTTEELRNRCGRRVTGLAVGHDDPITRHVLRRVVQDVAHDVGVLLHGDDHVRVLLQTMGDLIRTCAHLLGTRVEEVLQRRTLVRIHGRTTLHRRVRTHQIRTATDGDLDLFIRASFWEQRASNVRTVTAVFTRTDRCALSGCLGLIPHFLVYLL